MASKLVVCPLVEKCKAQTWRASCRDAHCDPHAPRASCKDGCCCTSRPFGSTRCVPVPTARKRGEKR